MLKKPYERFFRTLAHQQRLEIVQALAARPMTVTELGTTLKLNQTTLSHNLARLRECSFVFVTTRGKERVYSLNQKTIKPLLRLIDDHTEEFCKELCGCKEVSHGKKLL